jgi:predicted transcriptional regulator
MASSKSAPISTTTIKLSAKLKGRIARLAKKHGRTPHGLMVEAIEREIDRQERMEAFVREALDADRAIDQTGKPICPRTCRMDRSVGPRPRGRASETVVVVTPPTPRNPGAS